MKRIINFTFFILLACVIEGHAQSDDQIAYELENLETLNTRFSEFGAVPFDGGVILVSKRGEATNAELNRWAGGMFFDIYSGTKQDETNADSYVVSQIASSVNSRFHDGPVSYDPTNKLLYFTRSNKTPFVDEKTGVQIFRLSIHYVKYENGSWSEIQDFPFNERKHSVGHPAVSSDGKRIFFVSDKSGGFGGTDIYMCEQKKGEWSEPVNVGDKINSNRDEMFPFYHKSGRLYFASKGRGGLGGLDVFESVYSKGTWGEARNMGNPINGSTDDFALYINDDFTEGLLSSNRIGGSGSDDIYRVFVYGSSYINEPDVAVAPNVGDVSKDAAKEIEQKVKKEPTNAVATTTSSVKDKVEKIETTWEVEKVESPIKEKEVAHMEQQKNKGIDVVLPIIEEKKDAKIENAVTYLEEEQEERIIKAAEQKRTDLSEEDIVAEVEEEQIVAKTEDEVIETKEKVKEIFVNPPKEHTSDFRISGEVVDANGHKMAHATIEMNYGKRGDDSVIVTTDEDGRFSSKVDCCTAVNVASFKTNFYTDRITVDMRDTMPNYRILLTMQPFELNKGVRLDNIYFDRDQYYLRDEARLELDRVARLMKDNDHISVEIGAHTDSKGGDEKNLILSEKRAKVVVEYLVKQGVPSFRLRAKGYGESALLNHCTDELYCTDDLHAQNRRIEFKVISLGNYQESVQVAKQEEEVVAIPRSNYDYQAPEQTVVKTEEIPAETSTSTTVNNNGVRYTETITEEVIAYDEVASSSSSSPKPVEVATENANTQMYGGDVAYRIQLGAFSSSKLSMFTHLNDMGNLDEYGESGLFKYLVGYFYSMASAEAALIEIRRRGVPDAFIVGFQNGRKISKEEAQQYLY